MAAVAQHACENDMLPRRKLKLAYLRALKNAGGLRLARRASKGRLRILCYHGIWLGPSGYAGDSMFMRPEDFARRMALLQDLGYQVLPLTTAINLMQSGNLPDDPVAITIDDGWFGTYRVMVPVLRAIGWPATLYCDTAHLQWGRTVPHVLAAYLWKSCPSQHNQATTAALYREATDLESSLDDRMSAVTALAASCGIDLQPYLESRTFSYMSAHELIDARSCGVDTQLHTHTHSLHGFTAPQISKEIADNRAALVRILGAGSFEHFCYPSGEWAPHAPTILAGQGIRSATTLRAGLCAKSKQDVMLLPRLIDGSHQSDLEFEADLAGLGHWHRGARRLLGALRR